MLIRFWQLKTASSAEANLLHTAFVKENPKKKTFGQMEDIYIKTYSEINPVLKERGIDDANYKS